MLMTVTNTSGGTINDLAKYESAPSIGPAGVSAEGGQRNKPLPYPFGHIGALANAASKQLPVHPRDFRHRSVMVGSPLDAGEEFQQLVQNGTITVAFAAETGATDVEELFHAGL